MSVLSIKGQESKTVSYCHNHPPQYDACQPSEDILTSVLENEKTRWNIRILLDDISAEMLTKIQKMEEGELSDSSDDISSDDISPEYISTAEFYQDIGRLATEMGQLLAELANRTKKCAVKHTDLCSVMCRLSENEFNRLYDSLKRNLNQRMQHGLAQDHTNGGYCHDRDIEHESQRSLTTKQVQRAGNSSTSDQSLPSYGMANASKMNDDAAAAAKPRVRFRASLKTIVTAQLWIEAL
jgi:hypothetical protein